MKGRPYRQRKGVKRRTREPDIAAYPPLLSPKEGLYVRATVAGTDTNLLLDTGATDTLLSTSLYYQISADVRPGLSKVASELHQADGKPIGTSGSAQLEIRVGATTRIMRVIFADLKVAGLLGMDFLLSTGGILDMGALELSLGNERVRCTTAEGEPLLPSVMVRDTIEIPSGKEYLISGYVNRICGSEGPFLLEPYGTCGLKRPRSSAGPDVGRTERAFDSSANFESWSHEKVADGRYQGGSSGSSPGGRGTPSTK